MDAKGKTTLPTINYSEYSESLSLFLLSDGFVIISHAEKWLRWMDWRPSFTFSQLSLHEDPPPHVGCIRHYVLRLQCTALYRILYGSRSVRERRVRSSTSTVVLSVPFGYHTTSSILGVPGTVDVW